MISKTKKGEGGREERRDRNKKYLDKKYDYWWNGRKEDKRNRIERAYSRLDLKINKQKNVH